MEYLREIEHIVGEKLVHDDGTLITHEEDADRVIQTPSLPPDQNYSSEVIHSQTALFDLKKIFMHKTLKSS